MDIELYRKQYDFELDQKAQISASANIPISAATFIFGGLAAVTFAFDYGDERLSQIFMWVLSTSVAAIAVAVFYIFCSILGYKYQKLPLLSQLKDHRAKLLSWHEKNGSTAERAEQEFEEYFMSRLSEASDYNSRNNIIRGDYVHRATFALAVSVVLAGTASALFLYQNMTEEGGPQEVRVIGEVTVVPGGDDYEQ
jgi:hypothetical protein